MLEDKSSTVERAEDKDDSDKHTHHLYLLDGHACGDSSDDEDAHHAPTACSSGTFRCSADEKFCRRQQAKAFVWLATHKEFSAHRLAMMLGLRTARIVDRMAIAVDLPKCLIDRWISECADDCMSASARAFGDECAAMFDMDGHGQFVATIFVDWSLYAVRAAGAAAAASAATLAPASASTLLDVHAPAECSWVRGVICIDGINWVKDPIAAIYGHRRVMLLCARMCAYPTKTMQAFTAWDMEHAARPRAQLKLESTFGNMPFPGVGCRYCDFQREAEHYLCRPWALVATTKDALGKADVASAEASHTRIDDGWAEACAMIQEAPNDTTKQFRCDALVYGIADTHLIQNALLFQGGGMLF
jgi:hypothetical protein